MIVTHKAREIFFRYPYWETTAVVALMLGIGYMFDPDDICMLKAEFSFLTIILATITLFHGISSGLLAVLLIGIAMKIGYGEFNHLYFLRELVLVLVFGEFHYYWTRKIRQLEVESGFTEQKLAELGKAFYMLKISHDQIEKSYITKPMSLRNAIRMIKSGLVSEEPEKSYEEFLQLLQRMVNLESAYLCSVDMDGKTNVLAGIEHAGRLNPGDPMIESALEKKRPIYVSGSGGQGASAYLAVIPAITNKRISGFLAIEKMPFLSFNKDNLITISILITYFFDELHKTEALTEIQMFCPLFEENFRFELFRLHKLNREYGTDSTILVIKSYDKLKTHLLKQGITENLRTLDIYSSRSENDRDLLVVLFPFVDQSSIIGFINRIKKIDGDDASVEYASFSVRDFLLMTTYIKKEAR